MLNLFKKIHYFNWYATGFQGPNPAYWSRSGYQEMEKITQPKAKNSFLFLPWHYIFMFGKTVSASLPIVMSREGKWFVASCPALDIGTQGRSEKEVRENMRELIREWKKIGL